MRSAAFLGLAAPALLGAGPAPASAPPAGTWTNEEDRYFAAERGGTAPDWVGLEIEQDRWRPVDAYGTPKGAWQSLPVPGLSRADDGRWLLTPPGGGPTELRRGAPFTCWMAIPRFAKKPDGTEDYLFAAGLRLHDQGGRVAAGGGDTRAPAAVFRLRNVVWPAPSTNKPSLVLYVIRPDAPDRAVSYAWADPGADLIGINLRWMQGSCTRDGAAP